ncbi:16S rRNA (guanine(966)-N(2))-methyltransferase RsmD [candidate division WWE3 bacterium RIFCSPHIGHO2_01_FULL_42_13]|uniref:16S rRNA (Guanine(966)-N(2))-methyltransferase RsmD n=1 Tax=candidate division WWE3 bacterium RIFCSPHIGHO2_01_FULL_42_13 TaxID=1802617 RepID=A0A1F4URP3_UNCKA|nr:MAG: 16S rRNA (guanine(966)-N(2))-methyltransferase RsmD [candidate division WWE3 bacterium RIFCSPHIGHO2_01_FULL_42_13]
MLRITSGTAKGKKLISPEIPEFRAVQEVAKLAVFSILGNKVVGAVCLDLFAGSGNLGIEALSRGAAYCDFVDTDRVAEEAIFENLKQTGFLDKAEIRGQDAVKFTKDAMAEDRNYDIVFVDPFYKETHFKFLFENLEKILNPHGVVIFCHGSETDVKEILANTSRLRVHDEKRYGGAMVTVLQKKS